MVKAMAMAMVKAMAMAKVMAKVMAMAMANTALRLPFQTFLGVDTHFASVKFEIIRAVRLNILCCFYAQAPIGKTW